MNLCIVQTQSCQTTLRIRTLQSRYKLSEFSTMLGYFISLPILWPSYIDANLPFVSLKCVLQHIDQWGLCPYTCE